MKKYLLGFAALILAIGLSSFTNSIREKKIRNMEDLLYWYPVDPLTSKTTDEYLAHDYKSVMRDEFCDDDVDQPICFYGVNDDEVPIDTFVGAEEPENLIRQTE